LQHHCTQPRHKSWAPTPRVLRRWLFQPRLLLLADSMLAVPSARAGTVPTIGSAPHRMFEGQVPSRPCWRSPSFSPSSVHVNARGVEFPCVRIGDYNRAPAPPPPHLCTSWHEGSASLMSVSAITTAAPSLLLVCAHQRKRGRLPSHASTITAALPPCLCTSTHEGSTSLASTSAITATLAVFSLYRLCRTLLSVSPPMYSNSRIGSHSTHQHNSDATREI